MIYLIDNNREPEHHFWNCMHVLASEEQICSVLEGVPLVIGETEYQIVFEED